MTSFPLTLAVVSGKGGVGKSVLAVNLAEALVTAGLRVALLDADLGQSACPVLLNESPAVTLADVARGRAELAETFHPTAGGVTLIQGARTPEEVEAPVFSTLDAVLPLLQASHEVVLIDAPAGAEGPVRWALDRADAGLLVLVGEPTAVADAYALTKLIWAARPSFPLGAVVNFSDTEAEAEEVAERFADVTERFLGQAPAYLGWVPYAATIRRSVQRQTPVVREKGLARHAFDTLATTTALGPTAWTPQPATL
ncbi:MAG: P-loop NTPase [Rhodothermaceae bacterium]|nr:P-loop NTPase [Rhodothermaceae bacterium]